MKINVDHGLFNQAWYRKLDNQYKLFWIYLITQSDDVGVWEVDTEVAALRLNCKPDKLCWQSLPDELRERLAKLSESKWIIKKYVKFQYGMLNPQSKPHLHIIKKITEYGLDSQALCNEMIIPIDSLLNGNRKPIDSLSIDKDASPMQGTGDNNESGSIAYRKPIDSPIVQQSNSKGTEGGMGETMYRPADAPKVEKGARQVAKNFGIDPEFAADIWKHKEATEWKDGAGNRITNFAKYISRRWETDEGFKWRMEHGKTTKAGSDQHNESDPLWEHAYTIAAEIENAPPSDREWAKFQNWYADMTADQRGFLKDKLSEADLGRLEGADPRKGSKTS
jgi:hypothetical protein